MVWFQNDRGVMKGPKGMPTYMDENRANVSTSREKPRQQLPLNQFSSPPQLIHLKEVL